MATGALFVALMIAVVGVLVGSLLLHVSAKVASVPDATFGKAIFAFLANMILSAVLNGVLALLPVAGTIIAVLLSLILTLFVLKSIYKIGWGHSLLLWVIQWVVYVLMMIVFAMALGAGAVAIFG